MNRMNGKFITEWPSSGVYVVVLLSMESWRIAAGSARKPMPKAIWNDTVLAASPTTEIVEGDHYFAANSLSRQYFRESSTTSLCPWQGKANYYTVVVGGKENPDAAWYYSNPNAAAANIAGKVAFWKGVTVVS